MLQVDLCNGPHAVTVTYTRRILDIFRKRYWFRCWKCSIRSGPFKTDAEAWKRAGEFNEIARSQWRQSP